MDDVAVIRIMNLNATTTAPKLTKSIFAHGDGRGAFFGMSVVESLDKGVVVGCVNAAAAQGQAQARHGSLVVEPLHVKDNMDMA